MIRLILFAAIFCSSASFAQSAAEKSSGDVGRYQLVTANIVTDKGKAEETLFKIDTVTGTTWRYMSAQLDIPEDKRLHPEVSSANAEGWVLIGEFRKAFDKMKEYEKN